MQSGIDKMKTHHKQFLQEKQAAGIKHPFVLPIFALCETPCCIMYPYMENKDLQTVLDKQPGCLLRDDRIRITYQLCEGLMHLHREQGDKKICTVHRDIKPGNILLDKNFNARLGDLGLNKQLDYGMTHVTMTNHVAAGTEGYIDPHSKGKLYRPINDVFGVGIVMWQLLTEKCAVGKDNKQLWETLEEYKTTDDLLKLVIQVVWLNDDVTKTYVELAKQCLLAVRRITLDDLCKELRIVLKQNYIPKFVPPATMSKKCIACLLHVRDTVHLMTKDCEASSTSNEQNQCGPNCNYYCRQCLLNSYRNPPFCPEHGLAESSVGRSNQYALLIAGNPSSNDLETKIFHRDSIRMKNVLTDSRICGMSEENVILLTGELDRNANKDTCKENVYKALDELITKFQSKKCSLLIFYYTGHATKESFLIYPDLKESLSCKDINDKLCQMESENIVAILDCCYAGEQDLISPTVWTRQWSSSRIVKQSGQSASEEQSGLSNNGKSKYYSGKNSIFTNFVINGLLSLQEPCHTIMPFRSQPFSCNACDKFKKECSGTNIIRLDNLTQYVHEHFQLIRQEKGRSFTQTPTIKGEQINDIALAFFNENSTLDYLVEFVDEYNSEVTVVHVHLTEIPKKDDPGELMEFKKWVFAEVNKNHFEISNDEIAYFQVVMDKDKELTTLDELHKLFNNFNGRPLIRMRRSLVYIRNGPVKVKFSVHKFSKSNTCLKLQAMINVGFPLKEVVKSERFQILANETNCNNEGDMLSVLKEANEHLGHTSVPEAVTVLKKLHQSVTVTVGEDYVTFYLKENAPVNEKLIEIHPDYDTEMKRDKNFVGREEYIKEITQAMQENTFKAVAICGFGGIGKTSLGTIICCLLHHFSSIKVNLRGVVNIQDMLEKLLSKLGVAQPEEDMMNHLKTLLNTGIKRETIVFLDEVDELMPSGTENYFLSQLEKILDGLQNHKVKFLLTSRCKLIHPDELEYSAALRQKEYRFSGQLLEFELKELDCTEVLEVFQKRLNYSELDKNLTEEQLMELTDVCHGIPLAILMVEDQLHSGVNPSVLIEHLQSADSQFNESEKISKVINEHFKSLPLLYQEKMIQLSVFCCSFTIQATAYVLDGKDVHTEIDLYYLKSRHLVEIEDTSKLEDNLDEHKSQTNDKQQIVFSLHPLIQKYLREMINANTEKFKSLKEKAELRFLKYFDTFLDKLALEAEVDCIEATKKTFDQIRHISQALENMEKLDLPNVFGGKDYLQALKRLRFMIVVFRCHSKRLEYFQRMAKLAEMRGDDLWYMTMQCWVADHHMIVDQYKGFEEANAILEEIKPKIESMYKYGINSQQEGLVLLYALYRYVRARVYKNMQNFTDALKDAETARSIFKKYSKNDLQLARTYNLSGHIYHKSNDLEKALKYHQKAYYKLTNKGTRCGHYFDLVEYTMNIGSCYHRKGQMVHSTSDDLKSAMEDYQRALEWYKRSLKVHKDMNLAESSRTYNVLVNLTSLCIDMKDFNMALQYAKDGKKIAMEYMAGNPIDQVKSNITVGHIYRNLAKNKEVNSSGKEVDYSQMFQMSEEAFHTAMKMIQKNNLTASGIGSACFMDLLTDYPEVLEALGLTDKLRRITRLLHDMNIGCTNSAEDQDDSSSSTSDSSSLMDEHSDDDTLGSDSSSHSSPLKRPRTEEDCSDDSF